MDLNKIRNFSCRRGKVLSQRETKKCKNSCLILSINIILITHVFVGIKIKMQVGLLNQRDFNVCEWLSMERMVLEFFKRPP